MTRDIVHSVPISCAFARDLLATHRTCWLASLGQLRVSLKLHSIWACEVGASLLIATIVPLPPRGPHDCAVICFFLVTQATHNVISNIRITNALAGDVLAACPHRRLNARSWLRRVCFVPLVVVGTSKVGASLLVATIVPRGSHDCAVICFCLVTGATRDV